MEGEFTIVPNDSFFENVSTIGECLTKSQILRAMKSPEALEKVIAEEDTEAETLRECVHILWDVYGYNQ